MSITELMKYKNGAGRRHQLSLMLAQHCAPLIMYDKISNIITIDKGDFHEIRKILSGTDISYRILRSSGTKLILFLYRKGDFVAYLDRPDIRDFLSGLGYSQKTPALKLLDVLAHRIFFYRNDKISYPHEIGAFLGYPLCDVKGFIEHRGNEWIISGYWKVYDNAESTARLFELFEQDRDYLVRAVAAGADIREFMTSTTLAMAV